MARRVHVPAQAKIQGEIVSRLEIILHVGGVIVLVPTREMRKHGQLFLIGLTDQKAGEWVAGEARSRLLGDWREGRLVIFEVVLR